MKSPPKMPQRAMVRIWLTSLHQKTSVTITLVFVLPGILSFTFKGGFEQLRRCRRRQRKNSPVQQRRPLPAAEAGRSCWGCGQQDARAAQGTTQPLGAATRVPFYFARLATSTRAHQELQRCDDAGVSVLFELLQSPRSHGVIPRRAGASVLPETFYPFSGTKPTRSLTTSPPMMRPATEGTKALEPGTERRMVHLRWVPGGQMQ